MQKRKQSRLLSRILGYGLGLGVVVLIALGFVPKPVPVVEGRVERRTLEVTVDEPGRTHIRGKYVVSAPAAGQLTRITLVAGDRVPSGGQLAELLPLTPQLLDSRTRAETTARVGVAQANVARTRAAIQRAQSAVAFARDQAERARKLHAASGTSKQALEQAEYDERSAQEELANAQLGARVAESELVAARAALASMTGATGAPVTKLSLTAPVAGPVLQVFQESEGVVQPGTPLLEIGDPATLEIVVDVLSMDAVRIEPGAPARIERWGGAQPLNARVRAKRPSAFTTRSALGVEEQRVPVLLDLVDPREQWQALGDNYRVEARIRVAHLVQALVVPANALFRDGDGFGAFVVRAQRATKVKVQIGARTPDWAEVKSGVAEGDVVVLYPSDQVGDGVKVVAQSG
ncbi:MAG TPA: HlyD family efflux transporter periplasmic adaptor subunit [Polyangiales bacterium]